VSSARRGGADFPQAAHVELRNTQLRRNLGHATRTIRAKRAAVVDELDNWQQLRDAGAAIKRDVMANLDTYLVEFEQAATEAGATVHWAADGDAANELIAGIVAGHGEHEVVKVKSLTTDEIGLNDALAARGVEALETDFAELILQLDGDWSSHILVPAIHRNRTEIRDLLRRTIGPADLSDDPAALAEAARTHLRERFLRARVQLRRRRDRHPGRARVGGQRPYVHHASGRADQRGRDREAAAPLRAPGRLHAAASAQLHRRAHEPLHLALDRRHAGRRPRRDARRLARQRAQRRARRPGRA
jgi:hypothetical protein